MNKETLNCLLLSNKSVVAFQIFETFFFKFLFKKNTKREWRTQWTEDLAPLSIIRAAYTNVLQFCIVLFFFNLVTSRSLVKALN